MRIRTIKPAFFLHADLFDAEESEKLPLRVAFAGLWCAADREGRFKWEPRSLKAQILPYDNCDFSRVLHALVTRGLLVRYSVDNSEFGQIPSFSKHQVINNRESASVLPQPIANSEQVTRAPRVPHACPTPLNLDQGEGKGREGKGKEGGVQGIDGALLVTPAAALVLISEEAPPAETPKPQKKQTETDAEWLASLATSEAYRGISISTEHEKCLLWFSAKGRKVVSRQRFLNWLNKCDRPMASQNKPQIRIAT